MFARRGEGDGLEDPNLDATRMAHDALPPPADRLLHRRGEAVGGHDLDEELTQLLLHDLELPDRLDLAQHENDGLRMHDPSVRRRQKVDPAALEPLEPRQRAPARAGAGVDL